MKKDKLFVTTISFLLLVTLLICSCTCQEDTQTNSLQAERLAWEKLTAQVSGKSDYSYEDIPRLNIITNHSDARSLSGQVYPEVLEQIQTIDFSTFFVIAVFQGQQDTTGYSIEVADIEYKKGVVFVYANFREPSSGDVVGETLTSPYYILKVSKTEDTKDLLTFVLIANGEEVTRQTSTIH